MKKIKGHPLAQPVGSLTAGVHKFKVLTAHTKVLDGATFLVIAAEARPLGKSGTIEALIDAIALTGEGAIIFADFMASIGLTPSVCERLAGQVEIIGREGLLEVTRTSALYESPRGVLAYITPDQVEN